ncbi:MAG TPA: hypothetical protein VJV39_03725 [Dongiaceae bacterium]|nr:hypothetical protein [Dongiaceae bacterium]
MKTERRILAGALSALLVFGLCGAARAGSDDACKARFKEQVGNCANEAIADPSRDSSDFSFWKTCQAKYQAELDECLNDGGTASGASVSPPPTPECEEARIAIDWVFADAGATGTFARFREQGNSPMDSVIGAQAHNPHAQEMLRACAGWGANYLMAVYGDAVRGLTRPVVDVGPKTCEAHPSGLCYNGCQVSCPQGFAAYCEPGITWNMQCWRGPICDCRRP